LLEQRLSPYGIIVKAVHHQTSCAAPGRPVHRGAINQKKRDAAAGAHARRTSCKKNQFQAPGRLHQGSRQGQKPFWAEAEAQAKANRLLSESITPADAGAVRDEASRWNGQMPQVTGGGDGRMIQFAGGGEVGRAGGPGGRRAGGARRARRSGGQAGQASGGSGLSGGQCSVSPSRSEGSLSGRVRPSAKKIPRWRSGMTAAVCLNPTA